MLVGLRSRVVAAAAVAATLLLAPTVTTPGSAVPGWPPFLRARGEYPPPIAEAVARLWLDATLTRTVTAAAGPVPLWFYLRFVDAPDVAAAAARRLGLTTYDVQVRRDGWYVVGGGGATGVYRVLLREGGRRVVLSWGTHRGSILGTIGGSALTHLEFGDGGEHLTQRLVVNAIIDNRVVAAIARPLMLLFGGFVDRKLTEAFRTTAAAAAWAHANLDEFCGWLDQAFAGERRAQVLAVFDECRPGHALPVVEDLLARDRQAPLACPPGWGVGAPRSPVPRCNPLKSRRSPLAPWLLTVSPWSAGSPLP